MIYYGKYFIMCMEWTEMNERCRNQSYGTRSTAEWQWLTRRRNRTHVWSDVWLKTHTENGGKRVPNENCSTENYKHVSRPIRWQFIADANDLGSNRQISVRSVYYEMVKRSNIIFQFVLFILFIIGWVHLDSMGCCSFNCLRLVAFHVLCCGLPPDLIHNSRWPVPPYIARLFNSFELVYWSGTAYCHDCVTHCEWMSRLGKFMDDQPLI